VINETEYAILAKYLEDAKEEIQRRRDATEAEIATKDAEITALKREVSELALSLSDLYDLIARGMSVTDRDYAKITRAATLIALSIPDPAGGMPVEVE
jgi:chromosome segregation ATPase